MSIWLSDGVSWEALDAFQWPLIEDEVVLQTPRGPQVVQQKSVLGRTIVLATAERAYGFFEANGHRYGQEEYEWRGALDEVGRAIYERVR